MVVGFDNTDNAIMTTPTLTTVNQPRYRMGYTACNILLERMTGAAAPQSMTMETELVVRDSTTRSRHNQERLGVAADINGFPALMRKVLPLDSQVKYQKISHARV